MIIYFSLFSVFQVEFFFLLCFWKYLNLLCYKSVGFICEKEKKKMEM